MLRMCDKSIDDGHSLSLQRSKQAVQFGDVRYFTVALKTNSAPQNHPLSYIHTSATNNFLFVDHKNRDKLYPSSHHNHDVYDKEDGTI
jgi:hypothetical protein